MSGLATLPETLRALRPVKILEANLAKGRLAHAIFLKGDDLLVLQRVAEALAASVLKTARPAHEHPDFFSLRPAKRARLIAVGNRQTDEPNTVRKLIRDLNQSSNQGGYKVAVIYEADRMNQQAANAFLKTLEEPPPETLILLLSCRPYDLMDTIRSRCFQFAIPSRFETEEDPAWRKWLDDYRAWIRWLHTEPQNARRRPDRALLTPYGLVNRFSEIVEQVSQRAMSDLKLPEDMDDESLEALKIGLQKGQRDALLVDIEEQTRLAAIELSHVVPFPALSLVSAVKALESVTGLLALNMKDEAALEGFFLDSLQIWTRS